MSHLDLTQVGKYQILDLIGEGAMGVVYRALDPVLNRVVAIKVMGDAVARNDEQRDRFLREAQAAGSLQHPNVVTIFDFGEVDGHLFIAMEYLDGSDLEHILSLHTPLSIAEKLDIAIDVLSGLAYAHKRGLVHRDVKPANIRITDDGRAKIMDFGIVHLSSSKMTRTGVAMGTPDYMAPEQVLGDKVTPATDIFAMGSVLYELLTGARPFHAETLHSVMYKIVSEEPPPIDKLLPGLPVELVPVTVKALQKDPTKRYASALEFANALSGIRASLVGASPTTRTMSLRAGIDSGLAERARSSAPAAASQGGVRRTMTRRKLAAGVTAAIAAAVAASFTISRDYGSTPPPAVISSPIPAAPPSAPAPSGAAPGVVASPPAQRVTSERAGDDERSRALFRSLESSVLQARQRALGVGVPSSRLAAGDAIQRRASTLFGEGRITQASDQLGRAADSWRGAERAWVAEQQSRSKAPAPRTDVAAAATQTTTALPANPTLPSITQSAAPPPPPVARPTAPAADVESAAATEAAIASAISAYARAIESREIAAVRRANPGLTATQQRGFEQFFRAVRSLKASLTVVSTEITGTNAEARLAGAYDYVTGSGQSMHQPLNFVATLKKDGASWRLAAVR